MTQMPHRGYCSAALGCSLLDHVSVANIQFCLPSPSFVLFSDREIFHKNVSAQFCNCPCRHRLPSLSPAHTQMTVAHLKAVLCLLFFSKAATQCSCITVAVEQGILAVSAGADVTTLSADIVTEEIGSLFDLLAVIDCCAGGEAKSSFFVLFSRQTTIIYFNLSSFSQREKLPSFIASRIVRFGFLS